MNAQTVLSEKGPIFLIMDASPIVMLSAIERLDWLMEPCGTIWMTDMVMEEVTRDPETDADPRCRWLAYTRSWIESNKFRIRRVETKTYETYKLALEAWRSRGASPVAKPDAHDLGEASIIQSLKNFRGKMQPRQTIVVLMDDADGRDALRGMRRINLDVFGTRVFIEALYTKFGIADAEHAWQAILNVIPTAGNSDEDDPVLVRRVI
jgi:predicted nucleic acid-binding protein